MKLSSSVTGTAFLILAIFAASQAFAQAGRDGCYFGECPGGRPAPSAAPSEPPPRPASAPPRPQKQAASPGPTAPQSKASSVPTPLRKPSGPKVGGSFCKTIGEVADLVGEEFMSIAGRKTSSSTFNVTRKLPGADVCALTVDDGSTGYLCLWEVSAKNMTQVVENFAETVSNCFDGAESEALDSTTYRISATDDADILIVGDVEEKRVILLISESEEEEEEETPPK